MNKLTSIFLLSLLGLMALLFYNQNLIRRDLDTQKMAIARMDNQLFMLENKKNVLSSAVGDEFTSQLSLNLYNVPAKFKSKPYCSGSNLESGIKYADTETSTFKVWQIEEDATSFSPEDHELAAEGSFVISGFYILVDVTTIENENIKARFVINDMEKNGDILGFHMGQRVNNLENCPDFIKDAFN